MVDFESYKQDTESLAIGNLHPLRDFNSCQCSLCLDENDLEWAKKFSQWTPETETNIPEIQDRTPNVDLTDRNFLLLPPRVLGWAFKTGVFGQFYVDSVSITEDTEPDLGYNDRLFFPRDLEENKLDMKSLIMAHTSDDEKKTPKESSQSSPILSDPVGGKGEGLVILLHGTGIVMPDLHTATLTRYTRPTRRWKNTHRRASCQGGSQAAVQGRS